MLKGIRRVVMGGDEGTSQLLGWVPYWCENLSQVVQDTEKGVKKHTVGYHIVVSRCV